MSRLSKASAMKTIPFLRYDKENLLFSFCPIYHDSYHTSDLNIKYLEHSHAFWPRKESVLLNIKLVILTSRCYVQPNLPNITFGVKRMQERNSA